MDSAQDTGASVPDPALVSDQAASRLAPAGFDPSRFADFVCVICQRTINMRWNMGKGRNETIPPICQHCEWQYSNRTGKATAGSFRDRREVMRGLALAEALNCEANRQKWSPTYAAA